MHPHRFHLSASVIAIAMLTAIPLLAQEEDAAAGRSERSGFSGNLHPSVAGRAGRVVIAWTLRTPGRTSVRLAILPFGQQSIPSDPALIAIPDSATDMHPSAAWMNDTTILVAWERVVRGRHFVVAQVFGDALLPKGPQFDVAGPEDTPYAGVPHVRADTEGRILLAWQDSREGSMDVYARELDSEGKSSGDAIRLNGGDPRALQGAPRVAAASHGRFAVLWADNREDDAWKLYLRSWSGGGPAAEVLVDSAQRKAMTLLPSACFAIRDTLLIVWKDYRRGTSDIYLRCLDVSTERSTPAKRVNDDAGDRWQRLPTIEGDAYGCVACWEDYRAGEANQRGDVFLQCFDRGGRPIGANRRVNDSDARVRRSAPQIASDGTGGMLIAWTEWEGAHTILVAQWLDRMREACGCNFIIDAEAARVSKETQ